MHSVIRFLRKCCYEAFIWNTDILLHNQNSEMVVTPLIWTQFIWTLQNSFAAVQILCECVIVIFNSEVSLSHSIVLFVYRTEITSFEFWPLITSTKEIMFWPLSVCLSEKVEKRISMKLGGKMGHWPEKNPLYFGADLYKGADPGIFHLSLSLTSMRFRD